MTQTERFAVAALAAVLLLAGPARAKDEACIRGQNCLCDTIRQLDPAVVFCEDFEDPALDGGTGWPTKYGPGSAECTAVPYLNNTEGTCPSCCVNVVKEGQCEVSTQADCVFQGGQSLGHRYLPGRDSAGGGGKSFAAGSNFGVTMAVKFSKNYQRSADNGNFNPRKTNEFGSSNNCILGCSSSSYSAAPGQTATPFHGQLWWNGARPTWTEVVGHGNFGAAFGWYPDVPAKWDFDRDHGLDSWHCWRVSIDGVKQANARIRHWIDDRLLVDLQNVDLRNMKDTAIDSIFWNHYYNTADNSGRYEGSTAAYRYEDNMVVTTAGEPVTCQAIGFSTGSGAPPPPPPPAPGEQLGAPGQPKLIP